MKLMRRRKRPTDSCDQPTTQQTTALSINLMTGTMSEHVYKHIEVTGSSTTSSDDAIRRAIAKAAESVRELKWFELIELRGNIDGNQVAHWQATVKIGFRLDDE